MYFFFNINIYINKCIFVFLHDLLIIFSELHSNVFQNTKWNLNVAKFLK